MSDGNRETELDYKNRLNAKLQDSGEIDQLKQFLRQRLNESGWTAEMKSVCKGLLFLKISKKFRKIQKSSKFKIFVQNK